MMFRGGRTKNQSTNQSVRPRNVQTTVDASFRRNAAFVSKSQREKAAQHRSATERQIEQKRQKAHQQVKRRIIFVLACGIVVFAAFTFRIQTVTLDSNASSRFSDNDRMYYQETIEKAVTEHTLFSQSWLLDTAPLEAALLKQFPEVSHIAFTKKSPLHKELVVTLRFRTPVFTWKDASGVQQYVDAEGILFAKNLDPAAEEGELTTIEDQSGTVLDTGTTVLTREIVTFIGQLHAKLPPLYEGTKIEKVIIPIATREVQVKMTGIPYVIKFSSNRTLEEQVSELQTLLQFMKGSGVTPGAVVDIRVPHKAFYR